MKEVYAEIAELRRFSEAIASFCFNLLWLANKAWNVFMAIIPELVTPRVSYLSSFGLSFFQGCFVIAGTAIHFVALIWGTQAPIPFRETGERTNLL